MLGEDEDAGCLMRVQGAELGCMVRVQGEGARLLYRVKRVLDDGAE